MKFLVSSVLLLNFFSLPSFVMAQEEDHGASEEAPLQDEGEESPKAECPEGSFFDGELNECVPTE